MNEFAKMDLFFFITSFVTAILGILLVVLLIYFIRILSDVKHISNQAKIISDDLKHDIDDLRQNVRTEGLRFKHLSSFFKNIFNRNKKGK